MKVQTNNDSKVVYMAPTVEMIAMESEGVIAASGNTPDYNPSEMKSSRNSSYSSASSNDLEDMINEILTVGE